MTSSLLEQSKTGGQLEGLTVKTAFTDFDSLPTLTFKSLDHESCMARLGLPSILCYAILGAVRLLSCYYLLVVTERDLVGHLPCEGVRYPIYLARKVATIPIPSFKMLTELEQKMENSHLEVLSDFCDESGFYFSLSTTGERVGYDLSRSVQMRYNFRKNTASSPISPLPDPRFHWNRHISAEFYDRNLHNWLVPVIDGFISICDLPVGAEYSVTYAMISRRGCQRAGARYHVRGADPIGNVANFAETEQIVIKDSVISSFIQIRGSIPLLWTQKAKGYTSPKPQIVPSIFSRTAIQNHFNGLLQHYPGIRHIGVISLIDQTGNEADLAEEFATQIRLLGQPIEKLRFIPWDFHEECRGGHFENVERLISMLSDDLDRHAYFLFDDSNAGQGPAMEQTGLIRTNCIDCLDRTNVVQSEVAKTVLCQQLRHLGLLISTEGLDARFAQFDVFWKNSWADNADVMSRRYTGTGALKTDYTRTGRRSTAGALSDAVLSTKRTLNRNWKDDDRQHGTDLFLGEDLVGLPSQAVLAALSTAEPVSGLYRIRKCSIYSSDQPEESGQAVRPSSDSRLPAPSVSTARDRDGILVVSPTSITVFSMSRAKMKQLPLSALRQIVRSDENHCLVQLHFEHPNCPHAKYFVMTSPRTRERLICELQSHLAPSTIPSDLLGSTATTSGSTGSLSSSHGASGGGATSSSSTGSMSSSHSTSGIIGVQRSGSLPLSLFICSYDLQHRSVRTMTTNREALQVPAGHDMYTFGFTNILSSEIHELALHLLSLLGRNFEPVISCRTESTLLMVVVLNSQILRTGNVHTNWVMVDPGAKRRTGLLDQYKKYRQKASGNIYLPKLARTHHSIRIPALVSHREGLLGSAVYFTVDDETTVAFINCSMASSRLRLQHEWPLMATFDHIFALGQGSFLPEDSLQFAMAVRWKSHSSLVVGSCQSGFSTGGCWFTCTLPLNQPTPLASSGLTTIQLSRLKATLQPSPLRTSGVPDPAIVVTARTLRAYATTPPVKKHLQPQWPAALACSAYLVDVRQLERQALVVICYDSGISESNILGVGLLPLKVKGPFELKIFNSTTFLCVGTITGQLDYFEPAMSFSPPTKPLPSPNATLLSPPPTASNVIVGNLIDLDSPSVPQEPTPVPKSSFLADLGFTF